MRKRIFMAILLVLTLVILSSCKLIVRDMDVVNNRAVLQLNDQVYTRGQIDQMVEKELNIMENAYASYGSAFDRASVTADTQDMVLNSLSREMVLAEKTDELGIAISEEDMEKLQAEAETTYADNLDFFRSYFLGDPEANEEAAAAQMAMYGYPSSLQETFEQLKAKKQESLLMDAVTADVAVSEEEVSATYTSKLDAQKAEYAEYPSQFEYDLRDGKTIYFTPEGMRYVKHIFLPFSEEDAASIADASKQLANADETADPAALNDQLDTLRVNALSGVQPTLDEVQAKLDAGESFEALMEEYNQDAAANEEPIKTNGYLLYADCYSTFGNVFRDEALALKNVGDVSIPVVTDQGVHLIQFVSQLTAGETPLASIQEIVHADALTAKKTELYEALVSGWMEEAPIVINRDALK